MCLDTKSEAENSLMFEDSGYNSSASVGKCENCNGACSSVSEDFDLDVALDAVPYDWFADSRRGSMLEEPSAPLKKTAHVTKFLCPRYAKYADAPSAKDSEVFTGGDGEVEIESCGWEVQIFEDRKPEVICTNKIVVKDFDDGTYQINDFVIEPNSDLGCGSFCSFKVASCTKDKGLYAIKTVSKRKAQKSSMLFKRSGNPFLNIEREMSILKQINHPNIVKLFEIMDDPEEDGIYFVFEYMDRGSILTVPTDHPLSEGLAVRYLRDVLYGVEYLHSKSIIHRDLKPENILLNTFGRAKIIDFGLSFKFENTDDMTRLPYGTPSFTAPECLDEKFENGYSACAMEMWALGVTLYALIFGRVPYYDDNLYELYRMIQEDELKIPNKIHISLDLRALLLGILRKDPNVRMKLPEIMSQAIFANKNSPNFVPDRCKTCKYYSPASCRPAKA